MATGYAHWEHALDDTSELQHPYQHLIQPQLSPSERRKLQNRLAQRKFRQKKSQQSKAAQQQQGSNSEEASPYPSADVSPTTSYSNASTPTASKDHLADLIPTMSAMTTGQNLPYYDHSRPENSRGGHSQQSITPPYSGYPQGYRHRASSQQSEMGSDNSDSLAILSTPAVSPGGDLGPGMITSTFYGTDRVSGPPSSHLSASPSMSNSTITHSSNTSSRSGTNSPRFGMTPNVWGGSTPIHGQSGQSGLLDQYCIASPGRPLLHVAAQKGHGSVLQILIEHHVDINERDTNGVTALHLAVENGHEATARLLLQHGADMNACDHQGRSPFYLAVSLGDEDVVRMFLMYGADPRLRVHEQ